MHHKQVPYHSDFSDGGPSLVIIVGEPTDGEPTFGEPATGVPDLFQCPKNTRDNGQGFIFDDHAQDVHLQVLPAPPSSIFLLPDDPPNEIMMAVVKDETQAHGSKYTWHQVLLIDLVKVDGNVQSFHLTKIPCATKSIALSFTVYGMLTPLPFDRGKMVSGLSLPCYHAGSFAYPIKAISRKSCAFILIFMECVGRLLASCYPVLPMGSDKMHKLHHAQVLAWKSEHLHPDPTWMWITQESHVLFPTSSSHLIWKYACFYHI